MKEFITITEAIKITGRSKSTIRRFVLAHNDNSTIIKQDINERNRPLYKINRTFLLSYFSINSQNHNNAGNTANNIEFGKKLLLIQQNLSSQKKQFKVILISLITAFAAIFIIGTYYHLRMVKKLDEELNFYINYQSANQENYNTSKEELKSAYKKLLDEKQYKIKSLEKTVEEYKTNSTIAEKHITTLEKDKDKLISKLTEDSNQ